MPAIRVRNLTKRYGEVVAVSDVDLDVESGEVFALLGPNGAGKTTTVEILEGHRDRTSGTVEVLGFDPAAGGREFRERIGIVLQENAVEKELTVTEVLEMYGSIYRRRRSVAELVAIVGLEEKADARIKTLSGGQRRRLELALGIVGDPDLIFLDEPTTGFDPSARRQAWTVVDNLRSLGKTILLTTHYMDEAQHLADRVAVINAGSIIASGTPETIGGQSASISIIRFSAAAAPPVEADSVGGVYIVRTEDPTEILHELTGWALSEAIALHGLVVERPSLEDVYLALTDADGGPARPDTEDSAGHA